MNRPSLRLHSLAIWFFTGWALAAAARAQDSSERALPLFDAYLAQAAHSNPAYRADLRAGGGPQEAAAGRISGQSAFLGAFTYRPKTYAELARPERALLLRDPQFHAYLLQRAGRARGREMDLPAVAEPVAQFRRFSIAPEEMLRPEPLILTLSPP